MIDVLIVEDDPMVSKLNRQYVESVGGFNVKGEIQNGEEALKFCKKNKIDLIILDIYMPRLNGVAFLKELRKRNIMVDVILVTASKETQNIDEVLKLGAVDYLIKPFDYERFKNSLENYSKRYEFLHSTGTVKQEELDRITKALESKTNTGLRKGLHKKTLKRIRQFLKDNSNEYLTSEIIAKEVPLSKVTIRRYLEYLESIGEVKLEVEYGSVGRPSHLYKYIGD
ncbi:response regulator [Maledivibacter halophilus]|uniref:Transcriptional regulatory protein n=1 Tax=Maledivibacter halophilus TaxID=36842 RepID=A0A1T5LZA7_9FIRM|nr:response regulator [Maledivibacter halophilus]SKC80919.1 two-component system, CitB family, response regulator DctR [Maledivibacter halophilus]